MQFYTDPDFVVMDFHCPYCEQDTTITVHDDGAVCCNGCGVEALPPMSYEEAYAQAFGSDAVTAPRH